MFKKYKHQILFALFIIAFLLGFVFTYQVTLPFCIGLVLAFSVAPVIRFIQTGVKNIDLAVTVFLISLAVLLVLGTSLGASFINRDFQRLNESFTLLAERNQDKLDETTERITEFVGRFYDFEKLEKDLQLNTDSLVDKGKSLNLNDIDTEAIEEGFNSIISFFSSNNNEETNSPKNDSSFFLIFFSSILYFILILFQLDYFEGLFKRYLSGKTNKKIALIATDFNESFIRYFRLRTKIVLIITTLLFVTFLILDVPGILLITLIVFILAYIPYLHYLALIPLSIASLVVSVENDQSFLIPFGIILGVFILLSVIEEIVLTPRIMEKNIGMNPVIMVLALSVWSFLFGLPGLLIGIPLTSLIIIYIKRYFLESYKHIESS